MLRNIILFTVLCFLLFPVSCTKENAVKENKIHGQQTLPGTWELRSAYGGYSPGFGGDFAAGNGTLWIFTDSNFERISKGNLYDSGRYHISSGINPATGTNMDMLTLDVDFGPSFYFNIANDTLTLYLGIVAADGTIDKYVRIKNP